MSTVIEDNFLSVQKKTNHVLIEQRVILSEQEMTDGFLDKVNKTKKAHSELILGYRNLIDSTVEFLSESRSISDLTLIAESINNLVDTTTRLIGTFSDPRFKNCYLSEAKEYRLLMEDIQEVLVDVQGRISNDKKLIDLLDSI
jgi:hypothetical protein